MQCAIKKTPLLLPKLLDLTCDKNTAYVDILNTEHKFSADSAPSGTDPKVIPVFGSVSSINNKKIVEQTFGLPFFRFKRGATANVTFSNKTGYSFDLHWHGLNISADIDGASGEVEFGVDTKIGTELVIPFPKFNNNSCMEWYHAHPMFISSLFVYGGVYGLVDIVEDNTKFLTDNFEYGNNHLMIAYQDLDLNPDGTMTNVNVYTFGRSCFGAINGTNCVNWYQSENVAYVENLYHITNKNLIKIDILNGTCSFRNIHVGVCDKNNNIKSFYLIQSDIGLRNPTLTKMVTLAPANRMSILVDLDDFKEHRAYLFFYNFDLTEILNMATPTTEYPNDPNLQITVPDIQNPNPTPFPTPIPSTSNGGTNLIYPVIPAIPQVVVTGINSAEPIPTTYTIKRVIELQYKKKHDKCDKENKQHRLSCSSIVKAIRKVVFGDKYEVYKNIIKINNFELDRSIGINYISLLNKKYFYNVPEVGNVPTRNFALFGDDLENYNDVGGDPNGSTECVNGSLRLFTDMWNSDELDFSYALTQYNLNVNNFKPSILPSCLFKIFPTNTEYINLKMCENDTLTVQLYTNSITYDDNQSIPIVSVTIIFPKTDKPLNITQWIDLVNTTFNNTIVKINNLDVALGTILQLDWTFFPYKISYITNKSTYIKTVAMKTINNSQYYVKFIGKWQLLQFFGKPLTAMMMQMDMNMNSNTNTTTEKDDKLVFVCSQGKGDRCTCVKKSTLDDQLKNDINTNNRMRMNAGIGMDQFNDNYNMDIQQVYAGFATNDPNTQIITYDDNSMMIIPPNITYLGFIDGFQSDSLMNFSTKLDSSEKWLYHNLDTTDSHPFHFHLTSGFVDAFDNDNTAGLVSVKNNHFPYLYSRDTYGIGPQQNISYYLKFSNYVSEDSYLDPQIKYLGYMYHCHYMVHHDMNMMGQYFVFKDRNEYFG